MAKATIYIRVKNEAKWKKIKDKSAYVNAKLNDEYIGMSTPGHAPKHYYTDSGGKFTYTGGEPI